MMAQAQYEAHRQTGSSVSRVFRQQPDRVAAAWRRLRFSRHADGSMRTNLLDDVVEPFIQEIGAALDGAEGSPWARTRAVLRLSRLRGARALPEELSALRRCLLDACDALGGNDAERRSIQRAVEEATDSALCHYAHLFEGGAAPVLVFGGLVVEQYERPLKLVAVFDTPDLH
jgi:hypothetical protein